MLKKAVLLIGSFVSSSVFSVNNSEIFSEIYAKDVWGNGSGNGSKYEHNISYIRFLEKFIQDNHIQTVVDLGCGDWQFSQYVNWEGVDYLGVDVVESVIENNNIKFSKENIKFKLSDGENAELPKADLLICKDCLQHLSHEAIFKILKKAKNYKYCLFTNDVDRSTKRNTNIENGDHRTLDMTLYPFFLDGKKLFAFEVPNEVYPIKETLLYRPTIASPVIRFFKKTTYSLSKSIRHLKSKI